MHTKLTPCRNEAHTSTTLDTRLYLLHAEMIAIILSMCESLMDYCRSRNGFADELK